MKCVDNDVGKCRAWGDPHVITYDGATNDVYGVANYTFTQFNTSFENHTNRLEWSVIMQTAPVGRVSYASAFTLFVKNSMKDYLYSIRTDFSGNVLYSYNFTNSLVTSDDQFEKYIRLNRRSGISYTTPFGLEVKQNGANGEVSVPAVYAGKLEGICGNFNYKVIDDFKCPDGKIWPFSV